MKRTKYTLESLARDAKQFTTRKAYRNGNVNSYDAARKRKIMDQICVHMDGSRRAKTKKLK